LAAVTAARSACDDGEVTAQARREQVGAQALVWALEARGVKVAFGLPGVHNLALWEALARSGIRLIGTRHEQSAVYAADGHARTTGELGVALTTTGPGAANALAATGEAWASHSPVLVITTDISSALRRPGVYRGALHETRDQGAMFAPVVKDVVRVADVEQIAPSTLAAADWALTAPTGPVYIELPTDLLRAPVTVRSEPRLAPAPRGDVDQAEIAAAAALCAVAERPLLWIGGGVMRAGAGSAAAQLASCLGAPMLETYMARGTVDPDDPCWVGLPPHIEEAGRLWDEADVVLSIGSDLDGSMTQNWAMPQPRTLIALNVDRADATKNYRADVVVEGDVRDTLPALRRALGDLERRQNPCERLRGLRQSAWTRLAQEEPAGATFLDSMRKVLTTDTVVFADMCIPGYWLAALHPFRRPRRLAYPVGWGTLGFAFPASIGAAAGQSDPVLCVSGDGGFLFACGELAVLAQERLPLTLMLVDDGGYGMLRYDQQRSGARAFGVDLLTPDWARLAAAFGVAVEEVSGVGAAMERALEKHLALAAPSMLIVRASMPPPPTTSPRWYRGSNLSAAAEARPAPVG
jgi:thiamine pyrophosphate-dependent acetolactate synthase large subunit-like protein